MLLMPTGAMTGATTADRSTERTCLPQKEAPVERGELLIDISDYATRRDAKLTSTISHKSPP
jgi:hypothetical protein